MNIRQLSHELRDAPGAVQLYTYDYQANELRPLDTVNLVSYQVKELDRGRLAEDEDGDTRVVVVLGRCPDWVETFDEERNDE